MKIRKLTIEEISRATVDPKKFQIRPVKELASKVETLAKEL